MQTYLSKGWTSQGRGQVFEPDSKEALQRLIQEAPPEAWFTRLPMPVKTR